MLMQTPALVMLWIAGMKVLPVSRTRMRQRSTFPSNFGRRDAVALAVILTSFFSLAQCREEGTITITFEGPPTQPPGTIYVATNYWERGTGFVGDFGRARPAGLLGWPDNGTTYIQPAPWPVACSRFDGLSFRLVSVDLAGYSDVVPDYPASFEGHRSDGSVVTTNFAVSGIAFQTYYFSSEFADLTNLLVSAGALDNLKMQLPSIQPLLSIGTYHYRSDSWVTLHAQGTLGLHYRLEYTDRYPTTNWITLTSFESSFARVEYVSTNIPPQRFFRAVELP
jgi:hypothetical protein